MFITRSKALALLLFTGACASASGQGELPAASKAPIHGGRVEFSLSSFDGERVRGRLLLEATVEPLVIQGRLKEWIDVELRDLRTCDGKEALEHFLPDFYAAPNEAAQVLRLQPGFLYGKNLSFFLFSKLRMKVLPQCFEADLWVWSLDRRVIVKHPILVRRTDKPAGEPAEGAETSGAP